MPNYGTGKKIFLFSYKLDFCFFLFEKLSKQQQNNFRFLNFIKKYIKLFNSRVFYFRI
jgi:hypothetical protein